MLPAPGRLRSRRRPGPGLRPAHPRDGGPPTGYAVIDSEGRVRYRTLDPEVVDHLGEVAAILRATP
ncbi:MAG: hypothetical protein CYG61_06425 [Actinobacteria bacterium]|nr:MAG: hypothetical protein CYG61_06425 [Actinomycetota bacterium]